MYPPTKTAYGMLSLAGIILSLLVSHTVMQADGFSGIKLYRAPQDNAERIPENLARWHMGASIILTENDQFQHIHVPDVGFFDESVFLSDNSALTFSISRGEHNYIIDFGQFMTISRFFLTNKSAAGSLQLLSSDTLEPVDNKKWQPLTKVVEFVKGVLPSVAFAEAETRYMMVRFKIAYAGLIGNFGATGPLTINHTKVTFDEVQELKSPLIDFEFASAHTSSRGPFVSGGPED